MLTNWCMRFSKGFSVNDFLQKIFLDNTSKMQGNLRA